MANHFNISGELTQELIVPGDNLSISKVCLTNIQKVSKCKVDLYIEKKLKGKFYFLKQVELPIGATLVFDDISINSASKEYGLYIKLTDGASFTLTGSIDVTGTNTTVPGSSTVFLTELSIGDEVVVSGETRTISGITSDTVATVSAAWGSDLANDTSPDCNPEALIDVIIS